MLPAYLKLCERAKAMPDTMLAHPDGATALWERLGRFHARRGYSPALIQQIIDAQRAESKKPSQDISSPEMRKLLDKLGRELGRL